ncbi:MAG: redoxin domain-containing protein [Pseudomonadota bacterium]|nr:redoxin domain-containing protein [Pseudomonadota bacterium]
MISVSALRAGALAVALSAITPLAAVPASAEPAIGEPAPDFTGIDSNGKTHTLSALRGKTVVLEWTNDGCPYVRKHYGTSNMQTLQGKAAADGVVWLSVISSGPGLQGHVSGEEANKLTSDRKATPAAVILDPEGKIGRAYGATATPHMYVITPEGKLAYKGAIDDKPTSNADDVPTAKNYVTAALAAVAAGKPADPSATRAYGCSVKYIN